ncbi:hypothetical protein F2Q68_00039174 [Brassica cretica]|uniref:Uncharacterized protein n=1 Tax=Brassica cretica TaxID=69181 RepID=A0A8S9MLK9_BRACR|nr:hypothetical protein F2Q68_00039174 [Brassica cretica]
MGVGNDPVMVFDHGCSCPRLPLCLWNTRKYPGEKGEGRTPLPMALTALKSMIDRVHWDMVPWPVRYKRAVRIDGELVEATSQLYQPEESDGTSSEVVQLS